MREVFRIARFGLRQSWYIKGGMYYGGRSILEVYVGLILSPYNIVLRGFFSSPAVNISHCVMTAVFQSPLSYGAQFINIQPTTERKKII